MSGHLPRIGRRGLLLGLSALATLGRSRLALGAGPEGDSRLVVVLLRGAMDGMAAVQPYGDPELVGLRGPLALPEPGQEGGVLDLGGFFGLHPRLPKLHAMFGGGELMPIHAACGPTRSRSHFEAQDLMESGAEQRLASGWLNRALAGLPGHEEGANRPGFAIGADLPLILRGAEPVGMYAPARPDRPSPDLYARLLELNHADPLTGPAVAEGLRARGFTAGVVPPPEQRGGFVELAAAAGRLMAAPGGPRVAALEIGGWDTHNAQQNRLRSVLAQLDDGLDALRLRLGPAWGRTAVLVMTEFGRTARVNGNDGTDHGTAGAAFLLGGAVAGGRVLADWPGLAEGRLHEKRDLAPTLDLRAVAKGLLRDHLGLPEAAVAAAFPGSGSIEAKTGLLRA
ncbi:Uncharacterized conserved protein, DUF1501 family [Roseomonas rosea]|uniref:Uncharacterized conserved protein, DUF1501 family n=1 Tax=Muricoccus roseus TaxID=198092 RepID=A0A1M6KXL9_9PROT|nr:DUF1501 domain-containing protein [Roseomonas rosea]SHJ63718.1 Uncharacterized conserved protein, DUF1501 family [Roseomonas rosea]